MGSTPSILLCLFFLSFSLRAEEEFTYTVRKSSFPPLIIHILEVNPKLAEMKIVRAFDECLGRETVQTLAQRHGALAAINGGFFCVNQKMDGNPAGVLKIDNEWYSVGTHPRAVMGWKKGSENVLIDQVSVKCQLEVAQQKIYLHGLNRPRKQEELIAYTPTFHRTTLTSQESVEVIIENQLIKGIVQQGSSKIPEKGFVLSFDKKSPWSSEFKLNQEAQLKYLVKPVSHKAEEWENLDYILGGAPLLIRNGQVIQDYSSEWLNSTFLKAWNARTAFGVKNDGTWVFVVIEGKKPWRSVGVSVAALAKLMQELGCVSALNLDGGSSSTLVIQGEQINQTTFEGRSFQKRASPIKISDAILILKR